jgi:hypothetical protein
MFNNKWILQKNIGRIVKLIARKWERDGITEINEWETRFFVCFFLFFNVPGRPIKMAEVIGDG